VKRRLKILISVLTILLTVGAIAGALYLRSGSFQRVARNVFISRIEGATGLECRLDHMELDVFRGKFILGGLTLGPGESQPAAFRLEVLEATGSFNPLSWKSGGELLDLNLVGPQITILTETSGSGWQASSILPALERTIEFAARRVQVRDGWLQLNNRRIPLEVALDDLSCDVRYQEDPGGYRVGLSYRNGRLAWARRNFQYDLKGVVLLSLVGLDFESFEISRNESIIEGTGRMRNWDSPEFQFRIRGTIGQDEMPLFHPVLEDIRGSLEVEAHLRHDSGGFDSTGEFKVESGRYRTVVFRNLEGVFELEKDVLSLKNVAGQFEGGRLSAAGTLFVRGAGENPHSLEVRITNLRAAALAGIIGHQKLTLQNPLDADAKITWRRGLPDFEVKGKVRLHGHPDTGPEAGEMTDLAGEVGFQHTRGLWFLRGADLRSDHTRIEISAGDPGNSRLYLETDRPGEILRLVRGLSAALDRELALRPDLATISGTYRLEGNLALEYPNRIGFQGHVEVRNGQWRLFKFDSLSGQADWIDRILKFQALQLRLGTQSIAGDLVLDFSPRETEIPHLSFTGRVDEISLNRLQELGLRFDSEVAGKLSGSGSAAYDRKGWRGAGDFRIEEGQVNQYPFDLMSGNVELSDRRLRIADGSVSRGAAKVRVRGEVYLYTREMNLSTHLTELPLHELSAVREKELPIEGRLTAIGRLQGTFENPSFEGDFDLEALRYASWDLGLGNGVVSLKDGVLTADVEIQSEYGHLQGQSRISTKTGFPGSAALEFRDWNLRRIIEGDVPSYLKDLSTALQGNIRIEGGFGDPATLDFQGEMDGAHLKIHDYDLQNEDKIRFSIMNQKLHLEEARFVGDGSDLGLSGEIPLDGSESLDLLLDGNLNLRLLDQFSTQSGISGSAILDVRATGSLRDPQVIGRANLDGAEVHYGDFPYVLSDLQGNVVFSRNAVSFENVEGAIASGSVLITGSVEHENAEVRSLNLMASLKRARVSYPEDFRSIIDAELNLKGDKDSRAVIGEIRVVRADYQREFNLLEQLASRKSVPAGPRMADPILGAISLNILINSDDGLHIENEFANLRGKMGLSLRGTVAYPSLIGRVEVTEGYVSFRGHRFDLIQGAVELPSSSLRQRGYGPVEV